MEPAAGSAQLLPTLCRCCPVRPCGGALHCVLATGSPTDLVDICSTPDHWTLGQCMGTSLREHAALSPSAASEAGPATGVGVANLTSSPHTDWPARGVQVRSTQHSSGQQLSQRLPLAGMAVAATSRGADGSLFLASAHDAGIRRLAPVPFLEQVACS